MSGPSLETEQPRRQAECGVCCSNLLTTPRQFRDSVVRHGEPTSDRAASEAVFSNVFLHILPTRIHRYSLQNPRDTRTGRHYTRAVLSAGADRHRVDGLLQASDRPGLRLDERDPLCRPHGSFHAQHSPLGRSRHGGLRDLAYGPCVLHRRVQGAAAVQLGGRHVVVCVDTWAELYRIPFALGPVGVLGGDDWLGDCPLAARSDRSAGHDFLVRSRRIPQAPVVGRQQRRTGSADPVLSAARDGASSVDDGLAGRALLADSQRRRTNSASQRRSSIAAPASQAGPKRRPRKRTA